MSDDTRQKILERRARFVAAAIASVGMASCDRGPLACLEPVPDRELRDARASDASVGATADASAGSEDAEAYPMPCLSEPMHPHDAAPIPCLSMKPPPRDAGPRPCLKIALPPDGGPKPPPPKIDDVDG